MKQDYEPSEPTIKTSKINSGMLQVFRLDYLWKEANKYAIAGYYKKWNDILDRIWCELVGDVEETEDENGKISNPTEDKYTKLTNEYAKYLFTPSKDGFSKCNEKEQEKILKQKIALISKEAFLRKLQNKQGKGTAYDDEDDDFE